MTVASRHAEIAGAGIAGLATATALAHHGWSVSVHERDADLREIGAGIFLWPNGMAALRAFGADAATTRAGTRVESWDIRDERGRVLQGGRIAGDAFAVPRAALHRALLEAALDAGVDVRTSSEVVAADPAGHIMLASGERRSADLVVGADGIRSAVRRVAVPAARVRALGYGAQRLFVPRGADDPATSNPEWWNHHRRIGITPCGPDQLYVYMFCPPSDAAGRRTPLDRGLWASDFPEARTVIERLPDAPAWREIEEVRSPRWALGRLVLVGDAAHAMAPNLGQGACTTMASVIGLAKALRHSDAETAIASWERERRSTVDRMQRYARTYSRLMTDWPRTLVGARSAMVWSLGRVPAFMSRITGTSS